MRDERAVDLVERPGDLDRVRPAYGNVITRTCVPPTCASMKKVPSPRRARLRARGRRRAGELLALGLVRRAVGRTTCG